MTRDVPPPRDVLGRPAVARVAADFPCRKCGYNLRGLPPDARCPECGSPVRLSTFGELLRFSDPAWLRRLRRGIHVIFAGVAVMVFGPIAAMAIGARTPAAAIVVFFAVVIGYLLMIVGTWMLTEPDPGGIGEERYGTSRKIIRVSLLVGLIGFFIDVIVKMPPVPPVLRRAGPVLSFLSGAFGVVGTFAQLDYLRKLALRIPDMRLGRQAHFLMYALGTSLAIFVAASTAWKLLAIPGAGLNPAALAMLARIAAIAMLGLLVFGMMTLRLLWQLGRRLREQAESAEAIWIQETVKQRRRATAPPAA